MHPKSGIWDLIVGGATALGVGTLGWLEVEFARTPDAADASVRELGTLLTVLFGAIAALWWNQSARLPSMPADKESPAPPVVQVAGNVLNGAAATFTVLSLFCSVFASSPWRSTGSWLSAGAVLVVLTFAGGDIRQAIPITLRLHPLLREIFVLVLIIVAAASLVWHFEA
jgi:hypothetical protein